MSNFANLTILGNVTADPEKSALPNGTETSRFNVAVNTRKGTEDVATFYRVNLIGKVAGVANQYLQKGRPVLIVGEPRLETFVRKDGSNGASIEVKGTSLQLLGSKPAESNTSPEASADTGDDDIPF
jgi:single-strand DNA-binding protein